MTCEKIRPHFTYVIDNINAKDMMPYIEQSGRFPKYMSDILEQSSVTRRQNSLLLGMISDYYYSDFIDVLRQMNNKAVLQKLGEALPPTVKVSRPIFSSFVNAVKNMKPAEIADQRGTKLLTSSNIYSESAPVSKLGIKEIPFLIAVYTGLYGVDTVMKWPLPPSKRDFDASYELYKQEVNELEPLLDILENGAIHVLSQIADDRIIKLFQTFNRFYVKTTLYTIELIYPVVKKQTLSECDRNIMLAAIHLMCFGRHSFIIRKTEPPKPNSYLLQDSRYVNRDFVVMPNDRLIIDKTVNEDESVFISQPVFMNTCPW